MIVEKNVKAAGIFCKAASTRLPVTHRDADTAALFEELHKSTSRKWEQGLICDLIAFIRFLILGSSAIFFLVIATLRLTAEWVKPNKIPI